MEEGGVPLLLTVVWVVGLLGTTSRAVVTSQGCQTTCGNTTIPFPFGIGKKCCLPGLELQCDSSHSRLLLGDLRIPIYNITLYPPKVRILVQPFSFCNVSYQYKTRGDLSTPKLQLNAPFVFSNDDNILNVLGCNTLAYMDKQPAGCLSICGKDDRGEDFVEDDYGRCSGNGCCQVALPPRGRLDSFGTFLSQVQLTNVSKTSQEQLRNVSIGPMNLSRTPVPLRNLSAGVRGCVGSVYHCKLGRSTNPGSSTYSEDNRDKFWRYDTETCSSVFLAEKGSYIFQKNDAQRNLSKTLEAYRVVLDWSVWSNNTSCSEAQADKATYACKSLNSECAASTTGSGYACKCLNGFQGNPYLLNGCQDTDECEDPNICKSGRMCVNRIGSHSCLCPNGTKDMEFYCEHIDFLKSHKSTLGIALGFGTALLLLLLIGGGMVTYKKTQKKRAKQNRMRISKKNHNMMLNQQSILYRGENITERVKIYPLHDLSKATHNFDESCVIGKGGHGTVYKGLLNLHVVAIKMSNVIIDSEIEQFINEVLLLSQVNHRNVVKLVGCCLETEVPLLVYEFISNGTLFDHLHKRSDESSLSWDDRLRIATELTSAITYLHSAANTSIFHRDIKSANILLDEKLCVKLSDFGASKSISSNQTHITTNVQGTLGYLDPEYLHTGKLTEKADVYGVGVILVELLTGQKPTSTMSLNERTLTSTFLCAIKENKLFDVVDPSMVDFVNGEEVQMFARLAVTCLSLKGEDRPTMKSLSTKLEGLMESKNKKIRNIVSKIHYESEENLLNVHSFTDNETTTIDYTTEMTSSIEELPFL